MVDSKGFDARLAVEILRPSYGTGYRIGGRLVLTAAHLFSDGASGKCKVRLRTDSGQVAGEQDGNVVWTAAAADVALVELPETVVASTPVTFGRLPITQTGRIPYNMYGWPQWAQTIYSGHRRGAGGRHLPGEIFLADRSPDGLLVLQPERAPATSGPDVTGSSWEGISGAAVVCDGAVVAVLHWHQRPDQPTSLEAVPITKFLEDSSFQSLLREHGLALDVADIRIQPLKSIHPARQHLEHLLNRHSPFGGRDAELDRLDSFVEREAKGCLFVCSRSGYGKTALLAHWVSRLQRNGESVCHHFISRADNVADEASTMRSLCEQLILYYDVSVDIPSNPSELRNLYRSLLTESARPAAKLVIVVDGLDEAIGWTPTAYDFPSPALLPEGVFVLFSARETAGRDWLSELELSPQDVSLIELNTLGTREIAALLQAAGSPVAGWAEDPAFLQTMYDQSQGDPFYLHYLVKDIQDKRIASLRDLEQQPRGLKGYLDRWWGELSQATSEQAVRDLLGYLLVAIGPLTRDDLTDICEDDALNGWVFEKTIDRVQRYVTGNEVAGYSLAHSRFRDYLREERIKERDLQPYQRRILSYCSGWRENRRSYPLRYYSQHLRDTQSWLDLFALAQDEEYEALQREVFPNAPNLPLEAAQNALFAAAETEDAGMMARFSLLHALRRTRPASPISVLTSGRIESAWEVADLCDPQIAPLWYLLLAWERAEAGVLQEARASLERLGKRVLPRLIGWQSGDFAWLFAHARGLSERIFAAICSQLLDDQGRYLLCEHFRAHNDFSAALATMELIEDPETRDNAVAWIALDQAVTDDAAALAIVDQIQTPEIRDNVAARIASLQAGSQGIRAALETSQRIENIPIRLQTLVAMAVSLGDARPAAARAAFGAALDLTEDLEVGRAQALAEIAEAQAAAGDIAAALETAAGIDDATIRIGALAQVAVEQGQADPAAATLSEALHQTAELDAENGRAEALARIALGQAVVQDSSLARATAEQIEESLISGHVAARIALLQAGAEDFGTALETAARIGDAATEIHIRTLIARKQSEHDPAAGRRTLDATLQLALQLGECERRVEALAEIAAAHAQAEDFTAALDIARRMVEISDQLREEDEDSGFVDRALQQVYGDIVRSQASAGPLSRAVETANTIEDRQNRREAIHCIAEAFLEQTDSPDAHEILEGFKETSDRAEFLLQTALLKGREGLSEEVRALLDDALQTASRIELAAERVWLLGAIGAGQAELGLSRNARSTFGTLLQAEQKYATERTLYEAQSARDLSLAKVSQVQAEAGLFSLAIDLVRQIKDPRRSTQAFLEIAKLQSKSAASDTRESGFVLALDAAGKIAEYSTFGELTPDEVAESAASDEQPPGPLWRSESRIWVFGLTISNERSFALAQIAQAQAELNQFSAAMSTAERIEEVGIRVQTLLGIGRQQSEVERTPGNAALEAAWQVTQSVGDRGPQAELLKTIAEAEAEAGEFRTATQTAKGIADGATRVRALMAIAKEQYDVDRNAGQATLAGAIQLVDDFEDVETRVEVLADAAQTQAEAREFSAALTTARQISTIASQQGDSENGEDEIEEEDEGEFEEEFEEEEEQGGDWASDALEQAYGGIMKAQAESGQLSAAFETALELEDANLQMHTLLSYLADAEIGDDRLENARAALRAAADVLKRVEDGEMKELWRSDIGKKWAQVGELSEALTIVGELRDEKERSQILAEVALGYARSGTAERALSTCERIFVDRNSHLPTVAEKLADIGDQTNFKRLLVPCAYYLDSAYTMCGLLSRLYPQQAPEVANQLEATYMASDREPGS